MEGLHGEALSMEIGGSCWAGIWEDSKYHDEAGGGIAEVRDAKLIDRCRVSLKEVLLAEAVRLSSLPPIPLPTCVLPEIDRDTTPLPFGDVEPVSTIGYPETQAKKK